MNILYFSAMFEEGMRDTLFDKGKMPHPASNKYHQLLCRGLAENGARVHAYTTLPISKANSTRKYAKWPTVESEHLKKQYISVWNIKGVKHGMNFFKSFFKVLTSKKDTVVIYDALIVASSWGATLGARLRGRKSVALVTDLPEFVSSTKKKTKLAINQKLLAMADGYVFLTRQMDVVVNPKHKPYIVLEGHVDKDMATADHAHFSNEKKTVIYAGGLQKKYGIAALVDAFIAVGKDNEELHIYGDGDYADTIQTIAAEDSRICYFGIRPNAEVVEDELHATLLVNPRTSEGEYTKYSFPSKTMEYMVSGTPVLCAKLPGFPDEYDEYLYYFDETREDGLAVALRQALDRDSRELEAFGQKARSFVLAEKNHVAQAGRIIQFIKNSWSIS
ncbi:MAG: glycosyltransferase family 4 protein [Ruminococcaceae bacterium]|nr:glycosyltransferase family 4 protein [Oscillospiraceae bacterium]